MLRKLKNKRNRKGFSLIETLIATLLISVVVTSVFSVALTSKVSAKKTDRRAAALIYSKKAIEKVKAYITGDTSVQTIPGVVEYPANWHIPGDACNGCSSSTCYALENIPCEHDLTSLLPLTCGENVGICQGSPVNGKLTYTVVDADPKIPTGCVGSAANACCQFPQTIRTFVRGVNRV